MQKKPAFHSECHTHKKQDKNYRLNYKTCLCQSQTAPLKEAVMLHLAFKTWHALLADRFVVAVIGFILMRLALRGVTRFVRRGVRRVVREAFHNVQYLPELVDFGLCFSFYAFQKFLNHDFSIVASIGPLQLWGFVG